MATGTLAAVPLGFALALVALGGALAVAGYRKLEPEFRRHREDPIDVREAPMAEGLVELRGTIEPEEHVLSAPFTGTDCVAYEFEAEEYVSRGKNSSWDTLTEGGTYTQFRLADDTGSILVDPVPGSMVLEDDWRREYGPEETIGGRGRTFLEEHDEVDPGEAERFTLGPIEVGTGDRRRYTERRLDVEDPVAVYGPTVHDAAAGGEWGSEKVDAVVEPAEDGGTMVVADAAAVPMLRRSTLIGGGLFAGGVVLLAIGLLGTAGQVL